MEKIKAKKSPKKHEADFGLRILAVIIAVIIWFILSITQYPTRNKTITNVPVVFSMDGTTAEERGLSVLNYKDITVDVEIRGMNYEIGNYSANDLVATVNLDQVTKEGTYHLDIDVKSAHSSDKVTIVSVYPETVEVTFDRISTAKFEVGTEAPLINAAEGLTLKETSVSPAEVEIEGAENELKKIERVAVSVSKSMTISENTTISTNDVIFYDADDNVLDSSKYTIKDTKSFDVNFVIYKKKTANFNVEFTDCPPGFDVSSLPYSLSEESIQVISPKLDDADTENVKLGTISLSSVDLVKTFSFEVDSVLSSGEINQTGIGTIEVSFDSEGYTSRKFTIPQDQITIQNIPAGKNVTIETKQIPDVTIYGPENIMNSISADDFSVILNLSDVVNSGSINHAVTVYAPKYNKVWCYGTNEVQIEIEDKSSSTNSESKD